jgi:ubiquinone/menaquinone biosynthesis C-methylase UbiE
MTKSLDEWAHWVRMERNNIGYKYWINPTLYPIILKTIARHKNAAVADFGVGTGGLELDILKGPKQAVRVWYGIDQSTALLKIARHRLQKTTRAYDLTLKQHRISAISLLPLPVRSIDIAIARHMLMHLPTPALKHHLKQVSKMLKPGGAYIISIVNPKYEAYKFKTHNKTAELTEHRPFAYPHGHQAQYGFFTQYHRSLHTYEALFKKVFKSVRRRTCLPTTNKFKKTHPRYYQKNVPMSYVYILKP